MRASARRNHSSASGSTSRGEEAPGRSRGKTLETSSRPCRRTITRIRHNPGQVSGSTAWKRPSGSAWATTRRVPTGASSGGELQDHPLEIRERAAHRIANLDIEAVRGTGGG